MLSSQDATIARIATQHAEATLNHYAQLMRKANGAGPGDTLFTDERHDAEVAALAAVIGHHLASIDLNTKD